MSQFEKLISKILSGTSDKNIDFDDLCKLLAKLGFESRIKESHHIFYMQNVSEIINLQPSRENKSKPYQVKQVRDLIIKYRLAENV